VTIAPHEARELGLSKSGLYRAAKAGRYDRIARGLYLPADAGAADWDWLEAASRRPDATICLTSGLAHHDLTDVIPAALDVALPRGSRTPATSSAIRWHLFNRATFTLGRSTITIPGTDQTIGIYSPERCIADAFRLRGELGYELGRDALREWLRRGGKPARLMSLAAQLPRAGKPLLDALQAMA
jgi:predicted transcriptional regulator of viral defense system